MQRKLLFFDSSAEFALNRQAGTPGQHDKRLLLVAQALATRTDEEGGQDAQGSPRPLAQLVAGQRLH
ncbi:MAG: hypothetical protein ABSF90_05930 [Syntrophobacteraceae bacterium]